MARRKVAEPQVQEKREPFAKYSRQGWFSWSVQVKNPENQSWYATDPGEGSWTVHGSGKRAAAFAERKLRKLKRHLDWANTVTRMELK